MPKNKNVAPPKRRTAGRLTDGKICQFKTYPFDLLANTGYGEGPDVRVRMLQDWRRFRSQIIAALKKDWPNDPLPDICLEFDAELNGETHADQEVEIKGLRSNLP